MRTKVNIKGHPVHPMLIAFPVAFYTATLVAFIVYAATRDLFWWQVGFVANVAGVGTALLAAIPGFIDWAMGIESGTEAKRTGLVHMGLNVGALLLFAINLWVQALKWDEAQPGSAAAIVLSALGVALTIAAGFFGWSLVQRHHMGVLEAPEGRAPPPEIGEPTLGGRPTVPAP